jgi:iron complex outermembrane receptor protein
MQTYRPLILVAAVSTAFSQPTFAAEENALALEEVVVTAQKRVTNLQRTPIAITAFSGADLANSIVTDAADLNGRVPNLLIGKNGANMEISIRGINSTNNVESGDPAAAFHIDGIYLARPIGASAVFYDLERVEVLNGPQGTLYGRNATAGSINVITNKPREEFEASLEMNLGNYDRVYTQGMVNMPLSDQFQVRAAYFTDDRDGYYDVKQRDTGKDLDDGDSADDYGARLHGLYQPTSNITLLLSGDYLKRKGLPPNQVDLPIQGDVFELEADDGADSDIEDWGIKAELNWGLDFATLTYLGSSRETTYQVDGSVAGQADFSGALAHIDNEMEQYSHELRLTSNHEGPLQWIGGLYYFKEKQDIYFQLEDIITIPMTPPSFPKGELTFDQPDVKSTSKAIFGQASYDFAEAFRVTAGLRYTEDEKSRTGRSIVSIDEIGLVLQEVPNIADEDWNKTTWKLGLDWFVQEDAMLYFSVSTGYKAGGYFDGIAPNDYDEEQVLAWEIGSKNQLFDNRLQLNLAAFYYDFDDFQVTQTEPLAGLPGGAQGSVTHNAGEAEIYGAEVSSILQATEADRFTLQLSYLHTEFTEFDLYDPVNDVLYDYSGNELNKSPKWTVTLGYQHEWSLGERGDITAGMLAYYMDDHYLRFQNDSLSQQDSYTKLDLNLTYHSPRGNWFVEAYGKNVTDEDVMVSTTVTSGATGGFAAPRTYGVRAGMNW